MAARIGAANRRRLTDDAAGSTIRVDIPMEVGSMTGQTGDDVVFVLDGPIDPKAKDRAAAILAKK